MKNSLIISGISHVGLFLIATFGIPWFDTPRDMEMQIIPVEMVDISKVTETVEIAKLPEPTKDKPKPPERRPERVAAALPPPPPKMASTMPLLEQPSEKPAVKPKPKPVQRAQAPRVTPRNRPAPSKVPSRLDIAALLNKIPESQSVTERLAERYGQQQQQMTSLDVRRQTMSISAAIQKKIQDQCWNPPAGSLEAGALKVTVYMQLAPDGSLARSPTADDYSRMSGPLKAAADSALRAVRMCAPYSDLELPKDLYEYWREIKMNFDPSGMV